MATPERNAIGRSGEQRSPLASSSLAIHLLRGVAGFSALIAALLIADDLPFAALALGALALIALRGCPTCWTLGLIETASCRPRGGCAEKSRGPEKENRAASQR